MSELELEAQVARLRGALALISHDMHMASGRGCETCREISGILGAPFGCYEYQLALRTTSNNVLRDDEAAAEKPEKEE